MNADLRRQELNVLGLRLPAVESGPGDTDEAVVFLHGHPGSSRDWTDQLQLVGEFARGFAFDLPGLGKADKPDNWDYTVGAYATVVAAVLNEVGINRAHLVMHDLGGGAGLLWAAAHPRQFASAVMTGTGVLIGYQWHRLARLQRRPIIGELMARLTNERGFRQTLQRYNRQLHPLPGSYISQLWEDYDLRSRKAMVEMYRAAPPDGFERLVPVFGELDRPALVLWGEEDPFVPLEQAELQRRSFPSAEVVVLKGSGHWAFIDNPDEYNAELTRFLRRHVGTVAEPPAEMT